MAAPPAAAQDRPSESVQKLVDELRAAIARGEERRVADPRFLGDLKALANKYDWPWRRTVFRDRFRDGDYNRDPVWSVAQGRFWVDRDLGLRSVVEPAAQGSGAAQPQDSQQQGQSDSTMDLFGTVLREMTRPPEDRERSGAQPAPAEPGPTAPAEIFISRTIGNAFALRLEFRTLSEMPARLEVGPYQGDARGEGYRLVYVNRGGPAMEIVRLRPWGSSVVHALDQAPRLDDGDRHRILWTRDAEGNMKVSIDGKPLIATLDRGLDGPFQGVTIVNGGGDYGFALVSVSEVPR